MQFIKHFLVLLILICGFSSNINAGGKSGQFGIGLTVTESSPVYIFHYWASDKITLSPEFSINRISEPSMTRFNIGFTFATHTRPEESFRPFVGVGFNYDVVTSGGESFGDIYFGPVLDRKSTRLNSSHTDISRMPSSA